MPKRVAPLNPMQAERIGPGEELIDGGVPGLRVTGTAAGPSWGLSVRVKGRRPTIQVGRDASDAGLSSCALCDLVPDQEARS